MSYGDLGAGLRSTVVDHSARWAQLEPVGAVNGQVEQRLRAFCESKRITVEALTALGARIVVRKGGKVELAYAGDNGAGSIVAVKYRPLDGSSHDSYAEVPSAWLRPIVAGKRDSLDWFVAEGETDGARLYGLVGDVAAVLVLPAGARTFKEEWAALIPRGARVALCHDADEDGDKGAEHAARIIKDKTLRLRPPQPGDWCDWDGSRDEFLQLARETAAQPTRVRTRGVILERVRPTRWLWKRRIPMGLLSLLIGEEGVGKGTLTSWIVAQATRGELDGDLHGEPIRVLLIGDEDAFEPIWVPRLVAAGANLEMLRTLDDGEYVDDLTTAAEELENAIEADGIGFVVFDALIDHVPAGDGGGGIYNPKAVRQALQPLRRITASQSIAALGLMHPIKGAVSNFRQLLAGSHQFNAVSRSSLLLAADPDDDTSRVLVRGKGNHSAAPRSIEFTIRPYIVELNQHGFEVPGVEHLVEGDRTINDLLKHAGPQPPVRDELADQLLPLLTGEPQTLANLARAIDRDPKDGSVRNALAALKVQGKAEKTDTGWIRKDPGAVQGARPLEVVSH